MSRVTASTTSASSFRRLGASVDTSRTPRREHVNRVRALEQVHARFTLETVDVVIHGRAVEVDEARDFADARPGLSADHVENSLTRGRGRGRLRVEFRGASSFTQAPLVPRTNKSSRLNLNDPSRFQGSESMPELRAVTIRHRYAFID